MSEFKKCTKGHYYNSDSEDCPYCNGETIGQKLKDLPPGSRVFPEDTAMCYVRLPSPEEVIQDKIIKESYENMIERLENIMRSKNLYPRLQYVVECSNERNEYTVSKPVVNIGRAEDNDLVLYAPTVSRQQHAKIEFNGAGFEIINNSQVNKATVNGQIVKQATLKNNDVITLGKVQITFYLDKEITTTSKFKKCPNNHFYSSDIEECPYCKILKEELESIPPQPHIIRTNKTINNDPSTGKIIFWILIGIAVGLCMVTLLIKIFDNIFL